MSIDSVFLFKVFLVITIIISFYAVARNLDIIKIILIYVKDKLLGN